MANEEHLAILKNGVEEWNRWRMENPEEMPDLSNADLQHVDLSYAGLSGANLRTARLSGADLGRADLGEADLSDANLSEADLSGADLRNANLIDATLSGANLIDATLSGADLSRAVLRNATLRNADLRHSTLSGANLSRADLSGANLSGANLSGAFHGWTIFADVDLSEALSLEEVRPYGPSTLGTNTLTLSKGKIPDAFLRGCGLTDWEIKAARLWDPDLTRDEITDITYEVVNLKALSPIVLHHVFISYSHADAEFVVKLESGLDKKRVRYWRDVHGLKAGRLDRQIENAIRVNPLVLLVLSKNSVESDWVEWEVSKGRELEKREGRDVLCPIALDDAWKTCDWEGPLRKQIQKYNILDFSDPEAFDRQFEKLVGGIVEFYPPG